DHHLAPELTFSIFLSTSVVGESSLRVDARKWATARLAPRKYGDRVEHDHKGGTMPSSSRAISLESLRGQAQHLDSERSSPFVGFQGLSSVSPAIAAL